MGRWLEVKNQQELHVKHRRLKYRGRILVFANKCAASILVISLASLVPISAISERKKSAAMEDELNTVWTDALAKSENYLDDNQRQLRAVEQNPLYLEYKARERLGWSKEGERILVFPDVNPSRGQL